MALQNTTFKIGDLCRTCLSIEVEMVSVFEIGLGTITLDSIIASTTGIKIEHGDGLPSTVCCMCKEKAINAYEFKARTQEANIRFRGLLKRENLEKTNNDNNLVHKSEIVEVKTERFARDNHDDYINMDLTLALSNVSETYNCVDTIKNEADDHCEDIFTAPSTDNENSVTNDKKNNFIDTLKYEVDDHCENIFTAPSTENVNLVTGIKKNSFNVGGNEIESTNCPVCGASFHNAEDLTKHAWKQHADLIGPKKRGRPKKLLTSTILRKLSEHGYNLKSVKDQKHKCVYCKTNFKTKDDWVLHLVQHKDVKVLSCLQCKKMYLDMKDFQRHNCMQSSDDSKDVKPAEPPDAPEEEKKLNLFTEMLLQDLLISRGDSESGSIDLCEECGALFISSVELGKHRDREHPELSSRCHLCDKVFATVKSAARHRAVCAQVERLFACASCGLRFAHEVSLNKHILRAHTGQSVSVRFMDRDRAPPQHRCDTCNRRFYRKDLLARHAKIHKSIEKCFECDICNKKFHRRDNLRSHMRVHDSRGAGVDGTSSSANLCLYCGRSFSNSSNLIVHMRRHTGEKPYKCDFCGKGFPRSSDLQCHRRSHTGEKPCICIVCGKAFARSNKLSRHMRVHTGMKPYKCPHCEKAFSQSNDLKLHVRRHTGDKPYVCELCGDRFIQGTALHNHRRAHGHFPTAAAPTLAPIIYSVQSITQTH